ncbi:MAG: PP2C family protein-serine/threonine phosphatase, partial [Candidatus Velthaea sp.]
MDSPPDGAFDRVCALAARIFEVPIATVSIVDEDRIWFKARRGLDAAQLPLELGLCASAVLQDEPYVVSDALTDSRTIGHSLVRGQLGLRFYAAAPITTADGYRLGTLNVIDSKPRQVTEPEMQTLRDLAAIITDELELRLEAMRQVKHERDSRERAIVQQRHAERLAQTLQRSLSPPVLPDVPGLEVAVHYRPHSEEQVGGDFYDLFPLADGRWAFFLGDVCGKGPEAARLTSLARYTLRTAAMLDEDPVAVLRDLNTALLMQPGDMLMCTAVYGEIDPRSGEIELAVAGHPAPLIARTARPVQH